MVLTGKENNDMTKLNSETRELTVEELDPVSGGLDIARVAKKRGDFGPADARRIARRLQTIDHMIGVIDPFARMDWDRD
jgi:hypothetical protein